MNNFTVETIEEENGELVLPLPVELLSQMGWTEETILEWSLDENGGVFIREKNEPEK